MTLPSGTVLRPRWTLDAFRSSPSFAGARAESYGAAAWTHYRIPGGRIDGKELLTILAFHDGTLSEVSLTLDLYPPGAKDWSSYSLDVEAATKAAHDRLLVSLFGSGRVGRLDEPQVWTFPWGRVSSAHDTKGGGTFIVVRYGSGGR